MHDTEVEDQLRSLLGHERGSIPDAGFSRRVAAMLPKREKRLWRREAIIPAMTLIGCLLGLIVLPGGEVLRGLLVKVPHTEFITALPIPWLILVYVLCWTAVASALERREGYDSAGQTVLPRFSRGNSASEPLSPT